VAIALLAGVEVFEFRLWRWAVRQRAVGGTEGLVGQRGTLIAGERVRIHGTTYQAGSVDAEPGDDVVVERTDGMRLVVRKVEERAT
jgi:membrane protein implicated in regulation of membrane protease activity